MTSDALPVVSQLGAILDLVLVTDLLEQGFEIGTGAERLAAELATRSSAVGNLAPCRFLQISDG